MARANKVASISQESLDAAQLLSRQLRQAPAEVRKAVRTRVSDEIEAPLVARIKASVNGPHGDLAGTTVSLTRGATPTIWLGRGGSELAQKVAFGAEFGGQSPQKRYVSRRTKNGRIVYARRTTMQFRPHLGRRGYFLVPTMTREAPNTIKKLIGIVDDALSTIDAAEVRHV